MNEQFPSAQGLYDPQNEHDSCGVGFVVDLKGRKSHSIVANGLEVLSNLQHRGATGSEKNTGDGAGILMQMPHRFFADVCGERDIKLPAAGQYGVGVVFLPNDPGSRAACEHLFEKVVHDEGQTFLGWREVPTDNSMIGPTAQRSQPVIKQLFIGRNPTIHIGQRRRRVRAQALRHPAPRAARRAAPGRPREGELLHPQPVGAHRRLQGDAQPRSAAACSSPTCRTTGSSRRWRWCTRGSRPTRSPAGSARILTGWSRTTARSTRCAATSTGCTRARACSSRGCSATTWRSASRSSTPTAAIRGCSTTCSSCWCSRGGRCRTR